MTEKQSAAVLLVAIFGFIIFISGIVIDSIPITSVGVLVLGVDAVFAILKNRKS